VFATGDPTYRVESPDLAASAAKVDAAAFVSPATAFPMSLTCWQSTFPIAPVIL
jgi:hypothetical protein